VKKPPLTNNMHESCSWTYVHERTITFTNSYLNQARQQCVSPPVSTAIPRQPPWLQRVVYVWLVLTWIKDLACDGWTAVHSPFSFNRGRMRHVSSSTRVGVSRITPSQGRAWCCGIVCWILLHVDRSQCNIVSMCGVFVH